MSGKLTAQLGFLTVVNLNACLPANHSLRATKRRVDDVFNKLSPLFDALYANEGRPACRPSNCSKTDS